MVHVVDRVTICDAYAEPDRHYQLLAGGSSRLIEGRRPSVRFLASARETKGGIDGLIGKQAALLEDMLVAEERENESVNRLRGEVRDWCESGYPGTALVTRRLLEWWFERDEERQEMHRRFFFAQREAIETVIYLYEVKSRLRMPETGDLIRYALKLATGTGKTLVMALLITWATLHKRKVSASTLSANFLVLAPNLTVRDRVSGHPRGDGLDPAGAENLYTGFDMVPPEYLEEFRPNIEVRNWQSISLDAQRDDWIPDPGDEDGRFIPASLVWAMRRRARQDPNTAVRRLLGNWRDLVIINDEAHHVYGEKRAKKGEDPDYIKWSRIIDRISAAARVSLIVDLSATPWYGSGSAKPDGTLFEWLVSDFSVYDAFESGLVKVVRLPEEDGGGRMYLDLWSLVQGAKTKEEYLSACRGAIESIYSSWAVDFNDWRSRFDLMRDLPPALLIVADKKERATWLFEHLTRGFELLRNPDDDDRSTWVTLQIDSGVFDADKGSELLIREMVNSVGKSGASGEKVRCIVSVGMLTEGWDVKSVTHILGLRAFGSPLLTKQIIGRGLRRTNYDVLNLPLSERGDDAEETVDAFGIPFIGFPVERRKRRRTGDWTHAPIWIAPDEKKQRFRVRLPNVRSWAVGVSEPLADLVRISDLGELVIRPEETPPVVEVSSVVGAGAIKKITLDEWRHQSPLLKTAFELASDLFDRTSPESDGTLLTGPTYDELLDLTLEYVSTRVRATGSSDTRDVGIALWRNQALNMLDTAIHGAGGTSIAQLPILGSPEWWDTQSVRPFQWTGITAPGRKSQLSLVPCHTDLERKFADFLDASGDVVHYVKNERLGFSVTYFENNRPRQYYPDFIIALREPDTYWIVETKGEIRTNTALKAQAAKDWCRKITGTQFGTWHYLLLPQRKLEPALRIKVDTFAALIDFVGE